MRSLLKPQWLLLVNTLPLALLALLCAGEYSVIHTLLPAASVALWQQLALVLGGLALAVLAAGGVAWRTGRPLGIGYAVAAFLAFSAFLGYCMSAHNQLQPRDIPSWMVPTDVVLGVWTFLMPTLAHALLVLVLRTTPGERPEGALLNFLLALAVPFGAFVVVQVLEIPMRVLPVPVREVLGTLLITLVPATFLYFLVRMAYIITARRERGEPGLVWKLLLSLVLPLVGLAVNAGLGGSFRHDEGVFGNFSSFWFYGLALLNGVLLCLPAAEFSPRWRLALLAGRSALLGYTAYFFVVFLPFLPLSVLAVILIGTGFLMLAPLLLLVLHLHELGDDVAALRPRFGQGPVLAALLGGAAVLPLAVTASYYHQRQVLHQALAYAYSPDYGRHYDLDADALASTLNTVRHHKERAGDFWTGAQQPYLSTYFNWLVLDNLMLSDDKLTELDRLFLNDSGQPGRWLQPTFASQTFGPAGGAVLRQLRAHSRYDARQQAWVSEVELEVGNTNAWVQAGEYATAFALPPGAWVSDYYLDINGRREPGLLAEQKAADWLYRQVTTQVVPHDPGLLAYADADHLRLRVYPVAGAAPRRTGFELLHREPLTLTIDGQTVALGPDAAGEVATTAAANPVAPSAAPVGPTSAAAPSLAAAPAERAAALAPAASAVATPAASSVLTPAASAMATPAASAAVATPGGAVVYLGAAAKQALPLVRRQPYYHFLLDVSAGQYQRKADYQRWIAGFLAAHPKAGPPRFTLVNTYATSVPAGADWVRQLDEFPNAGGYYLSGAVRRVLADAWQHPAATYPVLVAVTDSLPRAVLADGFAEFAPAFPEGPNWLVLSNDDRVEVHSLLANARKAVRFLADIPAAPAQPEAPAVRAWPSAAQPRAYLPATSEPSIVLRDPAAVAAPAAAASSRWLTGLLLRGAAQWQTLHPAEANLQYPSLVKASFRAHLLSPWTAFLALENDAQKAALQRKQDQTMAANANLDTVEAEKDTLKSNATAVPLDDYAGGLLLLAVAAACWYLRPRRALG